MQLPQLPQTAAVPLVGLKFQSFRMGLQSGIYNFRERSAKARSSRVWSFRVKTSELRRFVIEP